MLCNNTEIQRSSQKIQNKIFRSRLQRITRWNEKLKINGSLNGSMLGQGRKVSASGKDSIKKIKSIIRQKQETSQRKIAKQIQISQSTVHRALISEGIKKIETSIKTQLSVY